jgi:hypothetical protein
MWSEDEVGSPYFLEFPLLFVVFSAFGFGVLVLVSLGFVVRSV